MNNFAFLNNYIRELPPCGEIDNYLGPPKAERLLVEIEIVERITMPRELKEFYLFAYGAMVSCYKIFTIPEIGKAIDDIKTTYGDLWSDNILPFAYLMDVGDYVAFDLSKSSATGTLILDGFHEFPPSEWKGICSGLETWLKKMVENNFQPFWFDESSEPR